jgi:hypothetical protein
VDHLAPGLLVGHGPSRVLLHAPVLHERAAALLEQRHQGGQALGQRPVALLAAPERGVPLPQRRGGAGERRARLPGLPHGSPDLRHGPALAQRGGGLREAAHGPGDAPPEPGREPEGEEQQRRPEAVMAHSDLRSGAMITGSGTLTTVTQPVSWERL